MTLQPANAGRPVALYLKLVMVALLWGGTFVAGRVVAAGVPPFTAAFLRFAIAGVLLLLVLVRRFGGLPRVSLRQVAWLVLLALTGVVAYNALFFLGLRTISASRAALIIACNPVLIALFAALLFSEFLGVGRVLGVVLSLSGAAIVISRGDLGVLLQGEFGAGEWAILGCVASWVGYSLAGKVVLRSLRPLVAVTYACVLGALMLLPVALLEGPVKAWAGFGPQAWAGLLYLAVFGTALAFVWYYQGVREIGATRAGQFINLVPVSAVAAAALLLGERPEPTVWAGGALVCLGLWLGNRAVPVPQR